MSDWDIIERAQTQTEEQNMSDNDQSWADAIREGLAVTSEGLDVAAQARDTFSPAAPPPPPTPPPPDALPAPAATTYGIPGVLAVVRDEAGWGVIAFGRRATLLQAAVVIGVAAALYRLIFARRGRRGRRR